MEVETTGEMQMMNLNHLMVEAHTRRDDLLREAQMRRLAREAQQSKSESFPLRWLRLALAILSIRPF
jgi:hypothetical protein